jgi:hypothetical protein
MLAWQRKALQRLYTVCDIPPGQSGRGMPTASMVGMARYQADMNAFMPRFRLALFSIFAGDDREWVEEQIAGLEKWREGRVAQGWD